MSGLTGEPQSTFWFLRRHIQRSGSKMFRTEWCGWGGVIAPLKSFAAVLMVVLADVATLHPENLRVVERHRLSMYRLEPEDDLRASTSKQGSMPNLYNLHAWLRALHSPTIRIGSKETQTSRLPIHSPLKTSKGIAFLARSKRTLRKEGRSSWPEEPN